MVIETDKYRIEYLKKDRTVKMSGSLRLQNKDEYREIFDLLTKAASGTTGLPLILDMNDLLFLNSSGISSLSLFVIKMRKLDKDITIMGNKSVSWQTKSLMNFKKLYNKVEIIYS